MPTLSRRLTWAFASFIIATSLFGLPVYIFLPQWYIKLYSLSFATVGLLQTATAIICVVADPFLGALSDRWLGRLRRSTMISWSTILLCITFIFLFNPEILIATNAAPVVVLGYYFCLLTCTSLLLSVVLLNYNALLLDFPFSQIEKGRLISRREIMGAIGVMLGSGLPSIAMVVKSPDLAIAIFGAAVVVFALTLARWLSKAVAAYEQTTPNQASQKWWAVWPTLEHGRLFTLQTLMYCLHMLVFASNGALVILYANIVLKTTILASWLLTSCLQRSPSRYGAP